MYPPYEIYYFHLSQPRRLTEPGEMNDDKVSTHEQAFLIGLHKFMHDAKMPIGRIPSLGFKQSELFCIFCIFFFVI